MYAADTRRTITEEDIDRVFSWIASECKAFAGVKWTIPERDTQGLILEYCRRCGLSLYSLRALLLDQVRLVPRVQERVYGGRRRAGKDDNSFGSMLGHT